MYLKYLQPAGLIGQPDLQVYLESAGSEHGLINHVLPVGHPDDEYVVETVDAVDLGEQLVDDGLLHARARLHGAPLPADRVDLVEDDDVQGRLVALGLHVLLRLLEQLADVLLRLTLVLREHLWAIHHLRLVAVEGVRDLTGDKGLAGAWRAIQEHASDMFNIVFSQYMSRVASGVECPAEYLLELFVEAADPQRLEVVLDDLLQLHSVTLQVDGLCTALRLFAHDSHILRILNHSVCLHGELRVETENAIDLHCDDQLAVANRHGDNFAFVDEHLFLKKTNEGLLDIFLLDNRCTLLVDWVLVILIHDFNREFNLTEWVRDYLGKYESKLVVLCDGQCFPLILAHPDLSLCNLACLSNLHNEFVELDKESTRVLDL